MKPQDTISLLLVMTCVAFLAGGCLMVPKDKYDTAIAELERSREEVRQCKLELAALREQLPGDGGVAQGRPDVGPVARKPATLPADPADLAVSRPATTTGPAVSPELVARMRALLDDMNPGATSRAAPAVERFTGKITAVKDDLAAIDVGASKGAKTGQRLYIYRGGKFVGFLLIEHVEAGSAAGVVSDQQVPPAVGDKVTNVLE